MKTIEPLQISTPTNRDVMMTRVFDAPPRLVFEAMTKPEYIQRWYGPEGYTATCESDLRVGGTYRIVQRAPDGSEFGFRGEHRELSPYNRRVYTWIFEPMPDKEALVTETFEERDGKTLFTATTRFQSPEDRDAYLSTGATEGGAQAMNRVEALLKTMT